MFTWFGFGFPKKNPLLRSWHALLLLTCFGVCGYSASASAFTFDAVTRSDFLQRSAVVCKG